MKKSIIAVLLLLFAAAGNASAETVQGPKIGVPELRVDLGRVIQGQQASHVFQIINEGTETLVIQKVQPG